MRGGILLSVGLTFLLIGCASASFYDMEKVEKEFSTAMQAADNSEQKSKADLDEKKKLLATLKTKNHPDFKAIAPSMQSHIATMEKALADIAARKTAMRSANSSIASLSYSKKKVSGDDPKYAEVESAEKEFKAAAADVNRSLAEYATASDHLTEAIAARKLIFSFDVPGFHEKVRAQVASSQKSLDDMQTSLNQIDANGSEEKLAWAELKATAEKYADKAQGLSKISLNVDALALGSTKISNLDERWPKMQKSVADFDQLVAQLAQLNDRFLRGAQSFKSR